MKIERIDSSLTEIIMGNGLLSSSFLKDFCEKTAKNIVIVSDQSLKNQYVDSLSKLLSAQCIFVPSGEKAKTQETKSLVEETLFREGYGKDTLLIALGGGTVTDLVGFIASTYMRGIQAVFIPTTLLGMIDASIGGKTAINTPFGKNLLGSFYHPEAVFVDPLTLNSLNQKQILNGLAEAVKMGLISDAALWSQIEENRSSTPIPSSIILGAMKGKIAIAQKDPLETGLRRILNFGHTIAHGLETVSHYTLMHGEAVAIGCLAEAHLSMKLGYLPMEVFERISSLFPMFNVSLPENYNRSSFLQALTYDKKRDQKKSRFVLIGAIGQALSFDGSYCRVVTEMELAPTLSWMENFYGQTNSDPIKRSFEAQR